MDGFAARISFLAGLILVSAAVAPPKAQRATPNPTGVSGCYRVERSEWSRSLGPDAGYHVIPAVIRLDTIPVSGAGWRVSPDLAYAAPSQEHWVPRWTATADGVEVVWSNGYAVTKLELHRASAAELRGEATAESDAQEDGVAFPHAPVVARRVSCSAID
jgi:hypothetical protein